MAKKKLSIQTVQIPESIVVEKTSFGSKSDTTVLMDQTTGLPVTVNEKGEIIFGISSKLFYEYAVCAKKNSDIALYEYKIALQQHKVTIARDKADFAENQMLTLIDELEAIKEDRPSLKAIETEEQKLLKKLEALRAKKAEL